MALVCVTYNSASILEPLLQSLSGLTRGTFAECIFVDNASRDNTCALIEAAPISARILKSISNRGFAAAVNLGVGATTAEFVLLANPDVACKPGDIESLTTFLAERPNLAAVCPALKFPDGRAQDSIRRFPTHANIWFSRHSPLGAIGKFLPHGLQYTCPDPPRAQRIEAAAATFMLVRRQAWQAVGGMDESYFLYVEDTDLCKRWADMGYEVWIDPTVAVTHYWQQGSAHEPNLARLHRESIKRYFALHHSDKPMRNAIVSTALHVSELVGRLRRWPEERRA